MLQRVKLSLIQIVCISDVNHEWLCYSIDIRGSLNQIQWTFYYKRTVLKENTITCCSQWKRSVCGWVGGGGVSL